MNPILNIENLTKVCRESFSVLWEAAVPVNPRFSTVLQL